MSSHIYLWVHFIWSTAGREPMIDTEWEDRLFGYIGGILRERDAMLLTAGGMPDHIHVYASLPSTISLAEAANAMKANSSRWVHENFPTKQDFAWQHGYGAFSVSASADEQVRQYILNQKEHHRTRSFKEEYLAFLVKHEIEFDERYVFE